MRLYTWEQGLRVKNVSLLKLCGDHARVAQSIACSLLGWLWVVPVVHACTLFIFFVIAWLRIFALMLHFDSFLKVMWTVFGFLLVYTPDTQCELWDLSKPFSLLFGLNSGHLNQPWCVWPHIVSQILSSLFIFCNFVISPQTPAFSGPISKLSDLLSVSVQVALYVTNLYPFPVLIRLAYKYYIYNDTKSCKQGA